MKKPVALISNDWHLNPHNIELMYSIIDHMIQEAKKLDIEQIFILGDIFDDRKHQRQVVLNAFKNILNKFKESNVLTIFLPGNHDKSDYKSQESFLMPFLSETSKEECVMMFNDFNNILSGNIRYFFAPFFNEELWVDKFKAYNFETKEKKILLTHVGFQGSLNNDGSETSSPIKSSLFKEYDLVLSGHFHNQQQVAKNIYHLPSLYQRNYGEDDQKGFTVLYDDLSFDLIQSIFPKYHKVVIDLPKPKESIDKLLKDYSKVVKDGGNVRFEFRGSEKEIKSLKKERFESNGIDIKSKIKEIENIEIQFNEEIKKLDTSTIKIKFKNFCEEEELNHKIGEKYLVKVLEND